ncbi:MAG: T9SS type A sorting domain-containing protein, partial [Saprospiraceae bacterium]|nr:T9SS type A sorting domain-containing protein [Saprospiraceae bacterium]
LGCNPTGVPAPGAATATDGCSSPSITSALDPIVVNGCQRSQTRVYTATDNCGNTASCTQVFTWTVDVTSPTFTSCPAGSNLGCNPTGVPAPGAATATDGCSSPAITSALDPIVVNGCQRSQTRVYTATDNCGNTASCTQVFTWTVDVTSPTFTSCPAGSNLGCNPTGVPAPGLATATDGCSSPAITSALDPIVVNGCQRSQTRVYTATDNCGNTASCTQVFTWTVDVTPPTIPCPAGVTVSCSTNVPPANINDVVGESDQCGGIPVITHTGDVTTNMTCQNRFTVIRTYRAVDNCGNTATCTQVITVNDQTPPTLTVPQNITVDCYEVPTPGMAMATDNCSGSVTVTYLGQTSTPGVCPVLYTLTRTWLATDVCGNTSTKTQTITVTDLFPPLITVKPANVIVECSPENQYQLDDYLNNFGGAQATDCSTITWSYEEISSQQGCGNTFSNRYRFTATDACGNSSSVDAGFTVVDQTPPVFTTPPQSITSSIDLEDPTCNDNWYNWLEHYAGAVAEDNCGEIKLDWFLTFDSMGCDSWYRTVKFVATDECWNMTTAYASYNIVDNIPPVSLPLPDTIFVNCPDDVPNISQIPYIFDNYFDDKCGIIFDVTYVEYVVYCGIARTFYFNVTDPSGNSTITYNVTFVPENAMCDPLCTAGQEVWGDAHGAVGSLLVADVVDSWFGQFGNIKAGNAGRRIVIDDADCLYALLPGTGPVKYLPVGEHTTDDLCRLPGSLTTLSGALNNSLAAQVLTLELNIQANYEMSGRMLGMTHFWNSSACTIPPSVQSALGNDKSVYHLLALANAYLSKQGNYSGSYGADLLTALSNVNALYENCTFNDPCADRFERQGKTAEVSSSEMQAMPNPFTDIVSLNVVMPQSEKVQISIYNSGMLLQQQFNVLSNQGENTFDLDLHELPSGVYVITLTTSSTLKSLRVTKANQ